MKDHARESSQSIVALLLGVFVLLSALLFVSIRSKAEDTAGDAQFQITSEPQTITGMTFKNAPAGGGTTLSDTAITLLEGGDGGESNPTMSYLRFTLSDNNGCADIVASSTNSVNIAIYEGGDPSSCDTALESNSSTCYYFEDIVDNPIANFSEENECDETSETDTTGTYELVLPLQHITSAGTWAISLASTDVEGGEITDALAFTVNSDTFLHILTGTSTDFGVLAYSGTSTAAIPLTVANTGNTIKDVKLTAEDMNCSVFGSIPADGGDLIGLRVDETFIDWEDMTYDLSGAVDTVETDIAVQNESDINLSSSSMQEIFWSIKLPDSGLKGTCSGGITIAGAENL